MIFTPPGPGEAPIILDGGLGTHLERRGNDISGALWSAQILKDRPQEVRAAHADFFAAGAQVATTCSYQVTFEGCGEETTALLRASVRLAREAAEEAAGRGGGPRWVAASVGPYGAGPGPGTEYDGAYGKDERELARWHGPRAEALAAAGPDLLLAETIPSLPEVAALSVALRGLGLCALGVNCCSAREATAALGILRRHTDLPLLAYPQLRGAVGRRRSALGGHAGGARRAAYRRPGGPHRGLLPGGAGGDCAGGAALGRRR